MSQFAAYADYYDVLYGNKPYLEEVDKIESFLKEYSPHKVNTILSLGCGTGTYEIELAKRGYTIHGIDLSPDMLDKAREKIEKAGVRDRITLEQGDIRKYQPKQTYDAAIMMFNIAGYLHTPQDLTEVAKVVDRSVGSQGVFLLDAWYAPAVIADPPTDRTKVVEYDGRTIERQTSGSLDQAKSIVKIKFSVTEKLGDEVVRHVKEDHPMRYWETAELEDALKKGGLKFIKTTSFKDIALPATSSEWDMFVLAAKK